MLTGGTSGRVATFEARGDPLATNAPGATTSASTMRTGGPTSFLFQFDRLAPSESGTVFIDGVSQGGAGTDANGKGMITLTRPAAIGPHAVIFAGVTGDLAIAPLYVICAASYNFTLGTATFVPGVTDIGSHCDDCDTAITLPFPVMLYDQTFTSAQAGSNGHLTFGADDDTFDITCSPFGAAGTTYALAPYWGDQCTGACNTTPCTGCGIFTTTTGTSPNRVFYIEYRTNYYNQTINLNYEIALFENGSPPFRYIYNTINPAGVANDSELVVGVKQNDTTFTQYGCDPTGGQVPPVASGQALNPSLAPCASPTPTPTSTHSDSHSNSYGHSHLYTYPNGYIYSHSHGHFYAYCNSCIYSHSYGHIHTHCNCDGDIDTDSNANADRYTRHCKSYGDSGKYGTG